MSIVKLLPRFACLTRCSGRPGLQRAFTLIELLVVMLVIGILIAVAAPSFLGQSAKAQDSATEQQLAVAYRDAKVNAVSAAHQGDFATGAQLQAALQSAEPGYRLDNLASGTNDETTVGRVGICSQSSASELMLVGLSKSGTEWLLDVHPTENSVPAVKGNCTGAGGGTGSGPSVTPCSTPDLLAQCQAAVIRDALDRIRISNNNQNQWMDGGTLSYLLATYAMPAPYVLPTNMLAWPAYAPSGWMSSATPAAGQFDLEMDQTSADSGYVVSSSDLNFDGTSAAAYYVIQVTTTTGASTYSIKLPFDEVWNAGYSAGYQGTCSGACPSGATWTVPDSPFVDALPGHISASAGSWVPGNSPTLPAVYPPGTLDDGATALQTPAMEAAGATQLARDVIANINKCYAYALANYGAAPDQGYEDLNDCPYWDISKYGYAGWSGGGYTPSYTTAEKYKYRYAKVLGEASNSDYLTLVIQTVAAGGVDTFTITSYRGVTSDSFTAESGYVAPGYYPCTTDVVTAMRSWTNGPNGSCAANNTWTP